MCGITGYFSWSGRPIPPGRIESMTRTLDHRGPDDRGIYEDSGIALGHTRLSIIDLTAAGPQPMSNEDGTIQLVFNGEIYNFESLRDALEKKGHVFKSRTDSEVVIHQYEEDGVHCLEKFNGMFAFALWDSRRRRLFLARDRAGEKPLFYYVGADFIVFGSEIKAVLASKLAAPEISAEGLRMGLFYSGLIAPHTIVKDVNQIPPAHYLVCGANGAEKAVRYWNLLEILRKPRAVPATDGEWIDGLEGHLNHSVKLRMRSDAAYGAYLSGGIDSTAVVRAMSAQLPTPIKTFSFGFEEDSFDESVHASQVAKIYGTDHKNIFATTTELPSLVEKIVRHSEEYTPNPSFLSGFLLSRGATKDVKMVLSGSGADELLAGYETYQASILARIYRRFPKFLRRTLSCVVNGLPVSEKKIPLEAKLKRFVYGAEYPAPHPHVLWRHVFTAEEISELVMPDAAAGTEGYDPTALYRRHVEDASERGFLDALLYADFSCFLSSDSLVREDRMAMANGVEVRAPFLDHELVEFLFRMPGHLKLRRFTTKKYALKKILEPELPGNLLHRKKAGFNVPIDPWLRGCLREILLDTLTDQRIRGQSLFRPPVVKRMIDEHMAGNANHGWKLWNLLCLSIWQDLFSRGYRAA